MTKISIRTSAILVFAFWLLVLPLNWLFAALAAGMIHELCHYIAVLLLGGKVLGIQISGKGAIMEAEPMENWKAFICTLSGPVGSLALLLAAQQFPRLAICGLVQGVFNLLPIRPLDGGRILEILLDLFMPTEKSGRILRIVQVCILSSIFFVLLSYPTFLIIPAFFLLPRLLFGGTIDKINIKRYGYDRLAEENSAQCAETRPLYRRRI